MSTIVDYEIWVPSRKRVKNMPKILKSFPTAYIYIDENEYDDYAKVVPKGKIITHPPVSGTAEMRRLMLENKRTECLIMIDDDFEFIASRVGRRERHYTDAGVILQVIENAINVTADLKIPFFGFQVTARNPLTFRAARPILLKGPITSILGVHGNSIMPDKRLCSFEDLDMCLQALLKHRRVWIDDRWRFFFGLIWRGTGGLQGVRTDERDTRDKEYLRRKWGQYVYTGKASKSAVRSATPATTSMGIRVERKSQLVTCR